MKKHALFFGAGFLIALAIMYVVQSRSSERYNSQINYYSLIAGLQNDRGFLLDREKSVADLNSALIGDLNFRIENLSCAYHVLTKSQRLMVSKLLTEIDHDRLIAGQLDKAGAQYSSARKHLIAGNPDPQDCRRLVLQGAIAHPTPAQPR